MRYTPFLLNIALQLEHRNVILLNISVFSSMVSVRQAGQTGSSPSVSLLMEVSVSLHGPESVAWYAKGHSVLLVGTVIRVASLSASGMHRLVVTKSMDFQRENLSPKRPLSNVRSTTTNTTCFTWRAIRAVPCGPLIWNHSCSGTPSHGEHTNDTIVRVTR